MTDEELKRFYNRFYSQDWRMTTIDPNVLGWGEILVEPAGDGKHNVSAMIHKDRVLAGAILRIEGFAVKS